jgi:hypothetical protein
VVQAVVALCTSNSGEENLSIMVGIAPDALHVFCAQNGSVPSHVIAAHLHRVWKLIRKLHTAAVPPASPPRPATSGEAPTIDELEDSCYFFVRGKALQQAAKRFSAIKPVYDKLWGSIAPEDKDKDLMQILFDLVSAAHSALPHRMKNNFAKNEDWLDFRSPVRALRDFTNQPHLGYYQVLERLQSREQTPNSRS